MTQKTAFVAIVVFFIGIYFAIPSQTNIGYMLIEALANTFSATSSFLKLVPTYKVLFNMLGIGIVVGDIAYIVTQIKKRNII